MHPADVLFFKRPAEILKSRGATTHFLSRKKDIACQLLDKFGFDHEPITTAGTGLLGLALELLQRDVRTVLAARRFRPDVMIGFGGLAISHAGRALNIPSISFYDSENATLQTRLTWPFIDSLYVPQSYNGPTPSQRTARIPGTKELSYLHPSAFSPNRETAIRNGLDPDTDNFFIRVVAWRANHDIGKSGWDDETLRNLIAWLEKRGRVHLSTEVPLSGEFERLTYKGSITDVHHLIGHCRLIVGESATMASEAAILGVPAIYCGRDFPGYILELEAAHLLQKISAEETDSILTIVEQTLARPLSNVKTLRDNYVSTRPDWAMAVVEAVERVIEKKA